MIRRLFTDKEAQVIAKFLRLCLKRQAWGHTYYRVAHEVMGPDWYGAPLEHYRCTEGFLRYLVTVLIGSVEPKRIEEFIRVHQLTTATEPQSTDECSKPD